MPSKSSLLDRATAAINSVDPQPTDDLRIDRLPDVMSITGLARPTIYNLMQQGKFPASVDLGPRAIGWIHSEVVGWLRDRIRESRTGAPSPSRKLPRAIKDRNRKRPVPSPARSAASETTSAA